MGLGESTGIGAGIDPAVGETLLDDPRRPNEKRDLDIAPRVSSSKDSRGSISESGGTLAGSFWAHLLPVWEADRFLLAVPWFFGVRADPDGGGVDPSERVDLEDRVETRGIPSDPEDLADRTGRVDRGDSSADLV